MNLAFTIATANFLAQAKTVGDSFLEHNPNDMFVIYLFDKVGNRFETNYFNPIKVIEIDVDKIHDFDNVAQNYSLFELTTSLRPYISLQALNQFEYITNFLYIDCDIKVYNSFVETYELLKKFDIILSLHFTTPIPSDDKHPQENTFFNSGFFNSGFFAIKKTNETIAFLEWWYNNLKTKCLVNFSHGLFVDQIWLNVVPHYFKNVKVITDPGYNVAYWNLHERALTIKEDMYYINHDFPLVFFHFSGFDVNDLTCMSKYQNRYSFENKKEYFPLFEDYSKSIIANNYARFSTMDCAYLDKIKRNVPPPLSTKSKLKLKLKHILGI